MFSWKKAFGLATTAGLLAGFFSVILQVHGETIIQGSLAGEPSSTVATATIAGLGSSLTMASRPVRLVIPAIGVDASVQSVGLFWDGDGAMGIPTNFTDVAWYNGGPMPGAPGNAVIDGHLDGKNVKEAVFYNLGNVKMGDLVDVIEASGTIAQFKVTRVELYPYDASTTNIFSSDTATAHLNLITCAGDWIPNQKIYNQRVVVFTDLVTIE